MYGIRFAVTAIRYFEPFCNSIHSMRCARHSFGCDCRPSYFYNFAHTAHRESTTVTASNLWMLRAAPRAAITIWVSRVRARKFCRNSAEFHGRRNACGVRETNRGESKVFAEITIVPVGYGKPVARTFATTREGERSVDTEQLCV